MQIDGEYQHEDKNFLQMMQETEPAYDQNISGVDPNDKEIWRNHFVSKDGKDRYHIGIIDYL